MGREADLFQAGYFRLHSGAWSGFKIECEALSAEEMQVLCWELLQRLPAFGRVEGIPGGGLAPAALLERQATGNEADPLLLVDDVYTTGASMEAQRAGRNAIGAVLFARQPVRQEWIIALFTMAKETSHAW